MFKRFRERSTKLEHLDKGDYTPEEYEGCITELQRVNRWLGDTRALRHSLLAELSRTKRTNFSVVDVGAGSGELLCVIDDWSKQNNRQPLLAGIELNARSVRAIEERRLLAVRADAFQLPFAAKQFDYAICSLFTHHFKNPDVIAILRELKRVAARIFVIDLHRHPAAYFFYTTVGRLFLYNRLIREDGALSILRSFKPEELLSLAKAAGLEQARVERHFPYRLVLTA